MTKRELVKSLNPIQIRIGVVNKNSVLRNYKAKVTVEKAEESEMEVVLLREIF